MAQNIDQKLISTDSIGAACVIVTVDPDKRFIITSVNQAVEQAFSISSEKLRGLELNNVEGLDWLKLDQRRRTIMDLKRCVAAKEPICSKV